MESERDENVAPANQEKTTQAGYLSPFGLLAGVRAMLSPSTKDQQSSGPASPRSVLRDKNQHPLGPAAQAAQGDLPPSPADKSSWTERRERTSVASDNSFVSAVEDPDNNASLPDLLRPSSFSRGNGVESDTDTSTAYESAGEAEVSVSSRSEHCSSFSDKVPIEPRAFSSPYQVHSSSNEVKIVTDLIQAKGSDQNHCIDVENDLSETIQLEDEPADYQESNVSVSGLVETFGTLSLHTPLRAKDQSSLFKSHVTLDSDVSGDIILSPGASDESEFNSESKSLDSTFTADPNQTVTISPDASFSNESVLIVEQESGGKSVATPDPEISVDELEELGQTLNLSSFIYSDVSTSDSKVLGLDTSCTSSSESVGNQTVVEIAKSPLRSILEGNAEGETLIQRGTSVETEVTETSPTTSSLQETNPKLADSSESLSSITEKSPVESVLSPLRPITAEIEREVIGEHPQEDLPAATVVDTTGNSVVLEAVSSVTTEVVNESSEGDLPTPTVVEAIDNSVAAEAVSSEPTEVVSEHPQGDLPTPTVVEAVENSVAAEAESSEPTDVLGEHLQGDLPTPTVVEAIENSVAAEAVSSEPTEVVSEHPQGDLPTPTVVEAVENSVAAEAESSEPTDVLGEQPQVDLPTPTVVEAVENSVAAEAEPFKTSDLCGEVDPTPGAHSLDEVPLPVKVPRSFSEILEEQLAAEGLTSAVSKEDAVPASNSSVDDIPLPVKTPRSFDELLEEQLAADNNTAVGESESEGDPIEKDDQTASFEPEVGSILKSNNKDWEEILTQELAAQSELPPSPEKDSENPVGFDNGVVATLTVNGLEERSVGPVIANASISEEVPIPIRAPRTFEEILAAELDKQSDPEQAVPSFSIGGSGAVLSKNSNESFANIITSQNTSIELESETFPSAPAGTLEFESEVHNRLDSLIERCKLQEQDLEHGDPAFESVAAEARRVSLNCLNKSSSGHSEALSAETANATSSLTAEAQGTYEEQLLQSFQENTLEAEEFRSSDAFKDPSAFDFLSLHGGIRSARDLRKESLYVKFDPLCSLTSDLSYTMHPENSTDSEDQTKEERSQELLKPTSSASEKLISLSPSSSNKQAQGGSQDTSCSTPIRKKEIIPVQTPAHVMLNETLSSFKLQGTPVKQEEVIKKLQEHQAVLEEQDKAYQERIVESEQRLQDMEVKLKEKDKLLLEKDRLLQEKLQEKDRQLQEKVQSLGELNVIMKEYEKTISRLVAEKSQEKAALEEKQAECIQDRDQVQQHLNNMEIAFADLHTKYERLKSVVEVFKKNEETLTAAVSDKQANFDKMQNMYEMLKSHAVSKLEKANQDLEALKQKHQHENAKLKAIVKKHEVKTKSLEEALEQKIKENQALTAICDELINKVGE